MTYPTDLFRHNKEPTDPNEQYKVIKLSDKEIEVELPLSSAQYRYDDDNFKPLSYS